MKKTLAVFFAFVFSAAVAQTDFSLRYFGFTIHPFGDKQASLQPYKLDKHAYFVANFGGFASVDHYFYYDQLAVTLMQGVFTDCSAGPAGFSHIGIRGLLLDKGKHRILLDFGPLLYYRRDWNRFSDYYDSGFFHRYHSQHLGDIQYKVFWYAFELAWQWQLTEKLDFNFGFTPGIPLAMSFSAGLTYWPHRFEKKIEQPKVHLGRRKNPPVSAN